MALTQWAVIGHAAPLADFTPAIDKGDSMSVGARVPCGGEVANAGADYRDVHAKCSGWLTRALGSRADRSA